MKTVAPTPRIIDSIPAPQRIRFPSSLVLGNTLIISLLFKNLMSNIQNSDQELGYLKGKCEVYERLIPEFVSSIMQMLAVHIQNQTRSQENPLAAMFGGLVASPQFQEHMKQSMDQERARFDKEHPV